MDRPGYTPRIVSSGPLNPAKAPENDGFSRPPPAQTTGQTTTTTANGEPRKAVQQPKPQALPQKQGPSSILVSPRQKGNPVLSHVKAMPWEYSDIPADFVLGVTTCALFLSLKYHRLHPEYIYGRIRALQGKYNLRVLLTMVDIQNHEESLKELSKTSLINNVTLILCWKAEEAGRYLELYKTYEHAAPTGIRAHQATSYSDRLVEFVTTPRGINKTDAVSLVSNFGSIRTAINAQPEEIAMISGWGEKKVERWCRAVRDPFRLKKAGKRRLIAEDTQDSAMLSREQSRLVDEPNEEDVLHMAEQRVGPAIPPAAEMLAPAANAPATGNDADARPTLRAAETIDEGDDDDLFVKERAPAPAPVISVQGPPGTLNAAEASMKRKRAAEPEVSDGVLAALAKLRQS